MIRVFLIAVVASLTAGILPASALTCAQWCRTNHCRVTEVTSHRVCMNRCIASCRAIVRKRSAQDNDQHDR